MELLLFIAISVFSVAGLIYLGYLGVSGYDLVTHGKPQVLSITKPDYWDYLISVRFANGTHQKYRGHHGWKLYPQGTRVEDVELCDWLTAYIDQYEWSQESLP